MKWRRWPSVVSISVLAVTAWLIPKFVTLPITVSEGYGPYGPTMSHPLSKVVRDERPAFRLDSDKPWQVEFGRGSGWHGLDTIKLDQDGRAVLYRLKHEHQENATVLSWETATAKLPQDAVTGILKAIEDNRLMTLHKAYHADVSDGTQWVFWVRQGEREKAIYFDNHFPDAIVQFAKRLDEIVSDSVEPTLKWQAVPSMRSRDHERELWKSIR